MRHRPVATAPLCIVERQISRLYTGQSPQAVLELASGHGALLLRLRESIGLKLKCEQTMRIEARVNVLEFDEAANHQSRADEQHVGERNFHDDHNLSRYAAVGQPFGSAAASASRV